MTRSFSPNDRAALYLAAEGVCRYCGNALERGFHCDHRLAWALGGQTETANGDAICPNCNLTKGVLARPAGLREWQADALEQWCRSVPRDFLAVATPGAGKTRFAATIAARLLALAAVDLVVVVVPTERLKFQWADSLGVCGIDVEPAWQAADGAIPAGMHGVVVTYAQLGMGASADVLAHHFGRRQGLAVLDEVHHCGGELTWSTGAQRAFDSARHRLLLSGTPFRSDNNRIPFVGYDAGGRGRADYTYEYAQALADDVVRPVWFPTRGGRVEWAEVGGEIRSATFDDALDERDVSRRLAVALDSDGDWLPSVLDDACSTLTEMRRTDRDAAGLVLARDTSHAAAIAELFRNRYGIDPVTATSADPSARTAIEAFASGEAPWIVAVKMVSEGVDIPRLRVGVYATTVASELFFRQAVGRLVRVEVAGSGEHAAMFIPDDPRLRRFASTIAEMRDHVLDADVAIVGEAPGGGDSQPSLSAYLPIASEAADTGGIVAGQRVGTEVVAEARRILSGLDQATAQRLTVGEVALVLSAYEGGRPQSTGEVESSIDPAIETPLWRRRKQLRSANIRVARRLAYTTGLEHRAVNHRLNELAGIRSVADASIEQLEARLVEAQRWQASASGASVSQSSLFP